MEFDPDIELMLDEKAVDTTITVDVNAFDAYIVAFFLSDPDGFAEHVHNAPENIREGVATSMTSFYAAVVEQLYESGAVKPISDD